MALLQNVIMRGTHASRPAAGSQGLLYFEQDTGQLFRDSGSAWQLDDTTLLFTAKGQLLASSASATVGALSAGTDGYVLTADSTQTLGIKWAAAGSASLTTASNVLGADVTMSSANTYYDGPSVSLAAGTWLLVGGVEVKLGAATVAQAKLWDGTTTCAAGMAYMTTDLAGNTVHIALAAIVVPGSTTTYKISAAAQSATGAVIKAALLYNNPGNYASHLVGLKVA